MSDEKEPVATVRHGAVAVVRLDRAGSLNALTSAMRRALLREITDAAKSPDVRALVLTGGATCFCAGQDLREWASTLQASADPAAEARRWLEREYNPLLNALMECPKPVVAAVDGLAAGAGLSLAAACDVRIVHRDARLDTAFTRIALVPDTGLSWTLPRLIGHGRAMDWLLRPRAVDAATAESWGLATAVADGRTAEEEALELAAALADGPADAYAATKRLVHGSQESTVEEALRAELEAQLAVGSGAEHGRALLAFTSRGSGGA